MTAFSRLRWDKNCIGYGQKRKSKEQIMAKGKPGYSRVDFALKSASWTIESKVGYSKETTGMREKEQYKPQNVLVSLWQDIKKALLVYHHRKSLLP